MRSGDSPCPAGRSWPSFPNPTHFEAATALARHDDLRELVACGPDPRPHVDAIRRMVDAGFDHVAVVQVGPDQESFCRFWQEQLSPRLQEQVLGT